MGLVMSHLGLNECINELTRKFNGEEHEKLDVLFWIFCIPPDGSEQLPKVICCFLMLEINYYVIFLHQFLLVQQGFALCAVQKFKTQLIFKYKSHSNKFKFPLKKLSEKMVLSIGKIAKTTRNENIKQRYSKKSTRKVLD